MNSLTPVRLIFLIFLFFLFLDGFLVFYFSPLEFKKINKFLPLIRELSSLNQVLRPRAGLSTRGVDFQLLYIDQSGSVARLYAREEGNQIVLVKKIQEGSLKVEGIKPLFQEVMAIDFVLDHLENGNLNLQVTYLHEGFFFSDKITEKWQIAPLKRESL